MLFGFHNIFFEITYGRNAYVKTLNDAKILSKFLTQIGKKELRNVACSVTKLDEPIGTTFGNLVEMREVYQFLNNELKDEDIEDVVLNFGSQILAISGFGKNINENKRQIKSCIESGDALKSFERLITSKGGNTDVLKKDLDVKEKVPVMANETGYVEEIDVNGVRQLAKYLCAIRTKPNDKLDTGAGIVFNKKVGDIVQSGDILAYVYTNDETKVNKAVSSIKEFYKISNKKVKHSSRIVYNVSNV